MTIWIIVGVFIFFIILKSIMSHNISVNDAASKLREGALLIDVRTPGEFSSMYIPEAVNIPVETIGAAIGQKVKDKKKPVILHCHSGMRAVSACSTLRNLGYEQVWNVGSYSRAVKAAEMAKKDA